MSKTIQIVICLLLAGILYKLWNLPGRYSYFTIPPMGANMAWPTRLDTITGKIQRLVITEDGALLLMREEPESFEEQSKRTKEMQEAIKSVQHN